jgi:hypothetical protein
MAPCLSATSQISSIGADVAVHRIDAFERHQLRRGRIVLGHQFVQVLGIIVRQTRFSARLWRMPSIIEAWLSASE